MLVIAAEAAPTESAGVSARGGFTQDRLKSVAFYASNFQFLLKMHRGAMTWPGSNSRRRRLSANNVELFAVARIS